MAGNAEYQEELVSAASVFIFDAQADCAMLTLTLYEVLITFDREVRLVWQRKFNGATLLFLLNRYLSLLRLSVLIFAVLLFSDETYAGILRELELRLTPYGFRCSYGPFLVAGLEYGLLLVVAVFFGLRIYALTKRSVWLALLVFALLVVPFVVNVYIATLTTNIALPPPLFCITSTDFAPELFVRLSIVTRTSVFVGDLLVILITWHSTFKTWRAGRTARFKASLATLLLRDGTMYFIVILVLSTLQLLFVFYNDVRNIETTFADTLMPLLISRLILNLREFDSVGNSSTSAASSGAEESRARVTIMFASAHRGGTDSFVDSDSDSDSFLEETSGLGLKGRASESASASSRFAAFVDPLGAPVDEALDWADRPGDEGAGAGAPVDDEDPGGAEEWVAWNAAVDAAVDKARWRVQQRWQADDRC